MAQTVPVRGHKPTSFNNLGDHVLIRREPGLPLVEAEIVAHNFHRPHLVKVAYARAQTAEWIFRSRIAGPAAA
jgi:hypothetical protein